MKAFTIKKYSKEDKLEFVDVTEPVLNENEVLVAIHAASVNQIDIKLKKWRVQAFASLQISFYFGARFSRSNNESWLKSQSF